MKYYVTCQNKHGMIDVVSRRGNWIAPLTADFHFYDDQLFDTKLKARCFRSFLKRTDNYFSDTDVKIQVLKKDE